MKAELGSFYKVKSWCDAKDGLGVWRMGRVKQRVKDIITIHFDGWPDKWKQSYCIHSHLIAPFRMHSIGYTGQKTLALREWDFNEDSLRLYKGKICLLIANGFSGFSSLELTYFIRGDLYVIVDCLLAYTYGNPSSEVLQVSEFLHHVLDLCVKWLEIAPAAHRAAKLESPDNYLHDPHTAIYRSVHEVLDVLAKILGVVPRTTKFFNTYKGLLGGRSLLTAFLSKRGVNALTKLLNSEVPLDDLWHFIAKFPEVFASVAGHEQGLCEFAEALLGKICGASQDTLLSVTEDGEVVATFAESFNLLLGLLYSPQQQQSFMQQLRAKLRLTQAEVPRAPSPKPEKVRKPPQQPNESSVQELRELIEERHSQCISILYRKIAELKAENGPVPEYDLSEVFQQKNTCDHQELAVLNSVEMLLSEDKTHEALCLLRWRKKILRIAMMSGWAKAQEVARKSYATFEIGVGEFFELQNHRLSSSVSLSSSSSEVVGRLY